MPQPLAICLEYLDARSPAERYVRCVALPGRQPGLRIDPAGTALWRSDDAVACELWISADDKLILFRPEEAVPVAVRRGGRALDVPCGKPVVLLDQDEFVVGGRRTRVHVHGVAPAVHAPSPLPVADQRSAGGLRAAAAAVALGAAFGAAGMIQVRCSPPAPVEPTPPPAPRDAGAQPEPDASAQQDIEVRVAPPSVSVVQEPAPPPPPPVEVRQNPPGAPLPIPEQQVPEQQKGPDRKPE
jgi:hypothetical protein